MKSLEDTLLDARAMLGHKRSGQCANEIAADIDQLLLQGEHAKDDNIEARFNEAITELTTVWWEMDVTALERVSDRLLQVIRDRTQGETLDDYQKNLPF